MLLLFPMIQKSNIKDEKQYCFKWQKVFGAEFAKSFWGQFDFSSLEKHITDFYDELRLGLETSKKLALYGNRGKEFEKEFNEYLRQSKDSLARVVKDEMNLQMMQSKDAKSAVDHIQKVLSKRLSSLKNFLKVEVLIWN